MHLIFCNMIRRKIRCVKFWWCEFVLLPIRSAICGHHLWEPFHHFTQWKQTNWFLISSFKWFFQFIMTTWDLHPKWSFSSLFPSWKHGNYTSSSIHIQNEFIIRKQNGETQCNSCYAIRTIVSKCAYTMRSLISLISFRIVFIKSHTLPARKMFSNFVTWTMFYMQFV